MVAFESSDNFAAVVILQTFLYGLGIPSTYGYILDPENSRADFKKPILDRRAAVPHGINLIFAPIDRKSFFTIFIAPFTILKMIRPSRFEKIKFALFRKMQFAFQSVQIVPFCCMPIVCSHFYTNTQGCSTLLPCEIVRRIVWNRFQLTKINI
jgi:hypothetical protein